MKRRRDGWDFPYQPVALSPTAHRGEGPLDVVVATAAAPDARAVAAALRSIRDVYAEIVLDEAPLHWLRVRSSSPCDADIVALLEGAATKVRYVAPTRRGTMDLAPPFDPSTGPARRNADWSTRPRRAPEEEEPVGGRWFLGPRGVRVDRRVCGTGAGVRLAVVDDDAADTERLDLDRLVTVGIDRPSTASGHAALMVGWAVGARRTDGTRFLGVAPDASVRIYCVPKPGVDVVSLPLAIVRATLDGADVIVCATYLEGTSSPMLDDALEIATRLGRNGRGTPVLLPTGRETSSPGTSLHASLSLALGDPASDPRVHCVAPSGRGGGWFLWRDARGMLRPFANRGPAVRWMAPGDDLAYPFETRERLFHAESSGASAVAAGVVALVLASNPELRVGELHALLARSVVPPERHAFADSVLADPADVLPAERDRDGHDAKCGYGRLDATRSCASARDPFSLALAAMGEDDAAETWCTRAGRPYSAELACWAVRMLLARPDLEHAARAIARHARLVAAFPARARAHGHGALARQLALLVRELAVAAGGSGVRPELDTMFQRLASASSSADAPSAASQVGAIEDAAMRLAAELWPPPGPSAVPASAVRE